MKKRFLKLLAYLLAAVLIPFALETPVMRTLRAGGFPAEYALPLSLVITAVVLFCFADRKRLRAGRLRRRAAHAAWREQERLRSSYVLNLTPYEYEEYVADELRREGFTDVDTTPKSGDFGADVLATDGNRRVCVQCKRYAPGHPVGVKAVQEIYSARDYYGCDDAYIYTTSDYTRAAVEMAAELGVILVRSQI